MKRLLLPLRLAPLFLLPLAVRAQLKPAISADIGYSTVALGMPTVGMQGELGVGQAVAELGLTAHSDLNNIAFGFLGGGWQRRQFAITAGVVYGGDQQVQDRYIDPYGDTTVIHPGASKGTFVDWYASWRIYPLQSDSWYMGITLTHGVAFIKFGFRVRLGRNDDNNYPQP